jgi:hypothetical protein
VGYELAVQGVAEIFGWSNDIGPKAIGSGISLFLAGWQNTNAQRAIGKLRYEMQYLDQRKLDKAFVHSDTFKEFVIQVIKNVSETASEVKQEAFVQLTMNTLQGSLETFRDKHLLRRLLDQISESEIAALIELDRCRRDPQANPEYKHSHILVAERLSWIPEDGKVALEGLVQLGLIVEGVVGGWGVGGGRTLHYLLTEVANRFILVCQNRTALGD